MATTQVAPRAQWAGGAHGKERPGSLPCPHWASLDSSSSAGAGGGLGEELGASNQHSSRHPSPRPGSALEGGGQGSSWTGREAPSRVQLHGARPPRPCASCWQQTGSFTRGDADKKDSCSKGRGQEAKSSKKPRLGDSPLEWKKEKKKKKQSPLGLARADLLKCPSPLSTPGWIN